MDQEDTMAKLKEILSPEELEYFLSTPNPYIDGQKPQELFEVDTQKLLRLADRFKHPGDVF